VSDPENPGPLKIEVSPNIVEHLGINLYTTLPRVLVEFVANAYDADSPYAAITADLPAIAKAREVMRHAYHGEIAAGTKPTPLAEQTLPANLTITVEDRGHGMTRLDLQNKFLRIGRKRRKAEASAQSPAGRAVMGRKGIGKLAGFGAARILEVVTKTENDEFALKITLDLDNLIGHETTLDVPVSEVQLGDDAGLTPSGTRIILSKLVFEPSAARADTIERHLSQHFAIVKTGDFQIRFNSAAVEPFARDYVFSYPQPDDPAGTLISAAVEGEGTTGVFSYRIRFTGSSQQLDASERGVRIYAHQRLACAPDLLDLGTGMHGFQNTHYLDGEVHADFIDEQPIDYIASNRQGLRWETPLLTKLREILTGAMRDACVAFQATKDQTLSKRIKEDEFTKKVVDDEDLPSHRRDIAFRVAAKLAAGAAGETADPWYRETLPAVVRGLSLGELLHTISTLATRESSELNEVVAAIARLSSAEWDDYNKIVSVRLKGIRALRRIYEKVNFKDPENEKELHTLLQANPWLIDPTYFIFLTSNATEQTLSEAIATQLQIGKFTPESYDRTTNDETAEFGSNKRPDLTFLFSSRALHRIVIVELKSPNTPLHVDHVNQLMGYMAKVREFMKSRSQDGEFSIQGILIGSRVRDVSRSEKIRVLAEWETHGGLGQSGVVVYDIGELLERTEDAHRELVNVYEREKERARASR
jgi:histidine kinase/DNA gyrase B/HSP90-like ATPase